MRVKTTTVGFVAASLLAGLLSAPAEAGCTRRIVNKSSLTALVRRDGGPWVTIPPHRSQAIRYMQPGTIEFALTCGRSDTTVYHGTFSYSAILDRCYVEFGDGFFEEQIGPGFTGMRDTKPLTVNVPRQGDVVIGPVVEEGCPALLRERLTTRY